MQRSLPAAPGLARQMTVFVLALGAAITLLDLVVVGIFTGSRYPNNIELVVVADLVALGAILVARRDVLAGLLVACAASTSLSVAVAVARRTADPASIPIVGFGRLFTPLAALPGTAEFGIMALLLVVTVRQRAAGHALLASTAVAGAVGTTIRWRLEQGTTLTTLVALLLVVAMAAAAATGIFLRLLEAKRAREAAMARAAERAAISRELHDIVGHSMTGIMLQAQAARLVLEHRPDLAAGALAEIEHAGAEALRSMRVLVRDLRGENEGVPLDPIAGLEAFSNLASASPTASTPVHLDLHPAVSGLPAALLASLHRVALEAVTNARRYGVGATAIDVRLAVTTSSIVLQVDNDGAAADPVQWGRGYGLLGIAERVQALGGTFAAGPRPTGGWTVRADVPVPAGGTSMPAPAVDPAYVRATR